jgi:hypothetical protein
MKQLFFSCLALALAGCAQQVPGSLLAPADPSQGLRLQRSASVTSDARDYKIIEPLEWGELNRRVSPQESR